MKHQMRTAEERIDLLHKRAEEMKRGMQRRTEALWGTVSVFLLILAVTLTVHFTGGAHAVGGGGIAGSSLLSEDAGGYVLVGVITFALGVAVTVLCGAIKKRNGRK